MAEEIDNMWANVLGDEEEESKVGRSPWQRRRRGSYSEGGYTDTFDDGAESVLDSVLGVDLSNQLAEALDFLCVSMMPETAQSNKERRKKMALAYPQETESSGSSNVFDFVHDDTRSQGEERGSQHNRKTWFRRHFSKRQISPATS